MLWLNRVQQCWAVEQHMQNCEHDLADQCRDVLAFSKLTCQMLLLRAMSVATLESFNLIFPYKLFKESLQVQNVITFFQHQCKITWRKLCFQDLHQWFPIITIATLGSFRAMLQQANNLNETFYRLIRLLGLYHISKQTKYRYDSVLCEPYGFSVSEWLVWFGGVFM